MKQLRLLLLALAVAVGAAFAVRLNDKSASAGFLVAMVHIPDVFLGTPEVPPPPSDTRARAEQQFSIIPAYSRYFMQFRMRFPAEYARVMDAMAVRMASTEPTTAQSGNLDRAFFQAARSLRQTHGILSARGGGGPMEKINQAQAAMMVALAGHDAKLCVDFFYGSAEPEFFAFMGKHREVAAQFASAWLDAMAEGKFQPVVQDETQDADVLLLDEALVAGGLSRTAIDALLENKPVNPPLPDAELCNAGISYFKALAGLSEGPRWRLMARLLELAART